MNQNKEVQDHCRKASIFIDVERKGSRTLRTITLLNSVTTDLNLFIRLITFYGSRISEEHV